MCLIVFALPKEVQSVEGYMDGRGCSSSIATCNRKPLPDVSVRYVIDTGYLRPARWKTREK